MAKSIIDLEKAGKASGYTPKKREEPRYVLDRRNYALTLGGNTINLNQEQVDWIKDRYTSTAAESYADTTDDYIRRSAGILPSAFEKSYTGSSLDAQLKELNLPSSKYIMKYVSAYGEWYGDGTRYEFSADAQKSIGEKFKSSWQYDYTKEDKRREKLGLPPVKVAAKYADSYADSQLLAMGLPPSSDLGKYVEDYDTVQTQKSRKDQFYAAVSSKWVGLKLQNKTGNIDYEKAFFDTLQEDEWADVAALYVPKKSEETAPTDDALYSFEGYESATMDTIKAKQKEAKASGEVSVTYDEFINSEPNYEKKIREAKVTDDFAAAYGNKITTVGEALDYTDAQTEKAAIVEAGKSRSGAEAYVSSHKDTDALTVLKSLYDGGVSLTRLRNAKDALQSSAKTAEEKKAIGDAFTEYKLQYRGKRYSASERSASMYDYLETKAEERSAKKEERKKYREQDALFSQYIDEPYKSGSTSTVTVEEATKVFQSNLIYDKNGKPSDESVEAAKQILSDAGATAPVIRDVVAAVVGKEKLNLGELLVSIQSADTVINTTAAGDEAKAFDVQDRTRIADTARQTLVGSGQMTDYEFDQMLRRKGWSDTISDEQAARDFYTEVENPLYEKNGVYRPAWEQLDDQARAQEVATFKENAPFDTRVHKSWDEQVEGQLVGGIFAKAYLNTLSGAVNYFDMATAMPTGRTEQWKVSTVLSQAAARANSFNRTDQSVGSVAIGMASDVSSEILRMYALSAAGSGIASMAFGSSGAISVISSSATSASTKGLNLLARLGTFTVRSSPFIATSMGSYYSEAMQNGATVGQATLYGIVCGTLEGATEALNTSTWISRSIGSKAVAKSIINGGKEALALNATKISGRAVLINLVSNSLGEGGEEMLSYVGSWAMQRATYDKDAPFDVGEMFQQGSMGALIGLFGSGMSMSSDTQAGVVASYLETRSGMKWAMGDGAGAVQDLLFSEVVAENLPDTVREQLQMEDGALSVEDYGAVIRDIEQHSRHIEDGKKAYEKDIAEISERISAASSSIEILKPKTDSLRTEVGIALADKTSSGIRKWTKLTKDLELAETELDSSRIKLAKAEADSVERTKAFTEDTEQYKIAIYKAQGKVLGHAVSMADAFRTEVSGIKNLLESGVTTMPTELGQTILQKMNAARAGRLADYMEQSAVLRQTQPVTAAEAAGAAQAPTGDNVLVFGRDSVEPVSTASTLASEQQGAAQPANVARSTVGSKAVESLNDRAIELERQPLSFSKEEMPFVDSAVKAVSSISAEIGTDIKATFPYAKSIVGMDYVSESMQDMALHVLNGDAEYLDGENLARKIERVIGTVRIDYVPTEVGLLGHDGNEIRDIRNQIRKAKISIGAYTATGFKYSVDDSIRTDKSLFGTIRLSKSASAQSADALYYELSNAYPDLFDPEVVNPSDQIRVMADFVRMTYNGRAESLSKIKSGEYAYYLAHDVAEKFAVHMVDSYFGVANLRNENGGKTDGDAGTVESTTGIVAETSSGSAEEAGRNEARTGENQSTAKVSQPQNPAEPMGAEATVSNKVATDAKPSSETMGIVDPNMQQGVNALRKLGRAAYKRIVSGSMGTERASRVQKKLGIGGASIDSSAQGIRNAQGTAQYILGDALVDINGTRIGKSLVELFKDIPQAKWADFQKYLLAKHTESRMTLEQRGYGKDKPVLASESGALDPDGNPTAMDANEAAAIAAKLEAENPNFVAIRDSYRSWWSGFMRSWAVDGGLMTETQFDALDAKYPDYVPTYRVDKNSVGGASSATRTSVTVSSAIRNATGSTDEIQDIRISLSDMVKRYVTMERRNELVQNLFNFAETHTKAAAEFATIFDEESGLSPDVDFVSFDELANKDAAEVKDGQYIIRGFRDGEKVSMRVSKDVYDAINYLTNPSDVSVRSQHENEILKGARAVSKPIKGVITGYNPFFALMNFARDAQTYFVNTKATIGDTFTNIGRAVSERSKNSALWQSYLALGGNASGYITSQQMTDASVTGKGKVANAVKKAGQVVGWLGGYTENMFRFAEYINGVNKYGDTAEGRRNAMADAADVTVNFSRSGAYTKAADAFCLYLNANVQGLDKMARTIANNPGKTALRGLSLAAIALLLRYITGNDDNPHYQNLTNYVKDSSYCIPNVLGERDDNGYCTTFIKIPKSREYGALIVATLERAARWVDGSESFDDAFADLGKDIGTSIGIRMEPIWTAAQTITTKSPKNYFGSDIVPLYMQDEAAPDQTTAQTSVISDAISERLYEMGVEVSPLVMDYIINQYGGFYGQLLTSATAKDANGIAGVAANIVTDKFVVDPLYQSGAVSRFYDAMDDAQHFARQSQREREALGIGVASTDEQYYDELGKYQKQMTTLRKNERTILSQEDDTPERKEKIDKIREQINEVANAGLALWAKRGR